jgi:lysyl-tRNA synthetase class 2
MKRNFSEQELIRRQKIEIMKKDGINPFSRDSEHSNNSKTLKEKYNQYSREELLDKKEVVSIVGRIMTIRGPFIIGKDGFGSIQAYVDKKKYPQILKAFNYLDIGDIVKFEGNIMKTNTGVLTIKAKKIIFLAKSLKPLPEKFHGLKDVEERYRKRYLDLIMNDKVKEIF